MTTAVNLKLNHIVWNVM